MNENYTSNTIVTKVAGLIEANPLFWFCLLLLAFGLTLVVAGYFLAPGLLFQVTNYVMKLFAARLGFPDISTIADS